jgi:hypothetical protein
VAVQAVQQARVLARVKSMVLVVRLQVQVVPAHFVPVRARA